jgi:hypothetical protein
MPAVEQHPEPPPKVRVQPKLIAEFDNAFRNGVYGAAKIGRIEVVLDGTADLEVEMNLPPELRFVEIDDVVPSPSVFATRGTVAIVSATALSPSNILVHATAPLRSRKLMLYIYGA